MEMLKFPEKKLVLLIYDQNNSLVRSILGPMDTDESRLQAEYMFEPYLKQYTSDYYYRIVSTDVVDGKPDIPSMITMVQGQTGEVAPTWEASRPPTDVESIPSEWKNNLGPEDMFNVQERFPGSGAPGAPVRPNKYQNTVYYPEQMTEASWEPENMATQESSPLIPVTDTAPLKLGEFGEEYSAQYGTDAFNLEAFWKKLMAEFEKLFASFSPSTPTRYTDAYEQPMTVTMQPETTPQEQYQPPEPEIQQTQLPEAENLPTTEPSGGGDSGGGGGGGGGMDMGPTTTPPDTTSPPVILPPMIQPSLLRPGMGPASLTSARQDAFPGFGPASLGPASLGPRAPSAPPSAPGPVIAPPSRAPATRATVTARPTQTFNVPTKITSTKEEPKKFGLKGADILQTKGWRVRGLIQKNDVRSKRGVYDCSDLQPEDVIWQDPRQQEEYPYIPTDMQAYSQPGGARGPRVPPIRGVIKKKRKVM